MPELSVLAIFIPTFFFISISPGLCMSLAMTLGMTIGVRKTLWMMLGEVIGVALVAILAVIGIASMMLQYPNAFLIFKWLGGSYLLYLGIQLYFTKVQINSESHAFSNIPAKHVLIGKGFVTAVGNPKGWAFMITLLPPFLDIERALVPQMSVLVILIMLSELVCMLIYANGGKALSRLLNKGDKAQWINRIGGSLLAFVGIWLAIA